MWQRHVVVTKMVVTPPANQRTRVWHVVTESQVTEFSQSISDIVVRPGLEDPKWLAVLVDVRMRRVHETDFRMGVEDCHLAQAHAITAGTRQALLSRA